MSAGAVVGQQVHPERDSQIVAVVSHVLNAGVRSVFDRLVREAPADFEVRMILSADDPESDIAGLQESVVDRITRSDVFDLAYPEKCQHADWQMAGNLDLVFLEFYRRNPGHGKYWFIEYDVHWEGNWQVFFEHFRASAADVLGATMLQVDDIPARQNNPWYPRQVVPPGMAWERRHVIKGFLPACRISQRALAALGAAYRAGLGGHYEINVPTVAAQHGMMIEDFGGNGPFVRRENRNRFYFAQGNTYTHSPGSFVFRPVQKVLPRRNTLWHPVKPGGVPAWHPLRMTGGPIKSVVEWAKPLLWQAVIRWWFAVRWNPLEDQADQTSGRLSVMPLMPKPGVPHG